ncbi:Hypothetical predicted protein [Scomber scombrus]|uniref:Uncharacterized protein n=1 Tax=Scomber scombrus TaxID=13677 RepID=A0AAV1NFF4_SCOSC
MSILRSNLFKKKPLKLLQTAHSCDPEPPAARSNKNMSSISPHSLKEKQTFENEIELVSNLPPLSGFAERVRILTSS